MAVIGRLVCNVQTPTILRKTSASLHPSPSDSLRGLLFYPEDGADMFLRTPWRYSPECRIQPRQVCCSELGDSNRFQNCSGHLM
jgi:hypothetical protein